VPDVRRVKEVKNASSSHGPRSRSRWPVGPSESNADSGAVTHSDNELVHHLVTPSMLRAIEAARVLAASTSRAFQRDHVIVRVNVDVAPLQRLSSTKLA